MSCMHDEMSDKSGGKNQTFLEQLHEHRQKVPQSCGSSSKARHVCQRAAERGFTVTWHNRSRPTGFTVIAEPKPVWAFVKKSWHSATQSLTGHTAKPRSMDGTTQCYERIPAQDYF